MAQTTTQPRNNSLDQILKEILETLGLSEEQQKKVFQGLDKAIILNLICRLEKQLPSEKKEELSKQKPETLEDVTKFFGEFFPKEEIQKSLRASVEEVIGKFLDKI